MGSGIGPGCGGGATGATTAGNGSQTDGPARAQKCGYTRSIKGETT
jgi:hypothetical protein